MHVVAAPKKVSLGMKKLSIGLKESVRLEPTVSKDSAASFTWTTKNKKIVSVTADGIIKGKKKGKTTITVKTHNGKKATLTVTVLNAPKKVTLDKSALEIQIGDSTVLKATLPKKTASRIKWSSSNIEVATVDADGEVTAVGPGAAIITASTFNKKKASCTVTVIANPEPTTEPEITAEPETTPDPGAILEITPEPSVEPNGEMTPAPTTGITPEPSVEPNGEVTPAPTTGIAPEASAEPNGEVTPAPTRDITPEPSVEPSGEDMPAPATDITPEPSNEPSGEDTPELVLTNEAAQSLAETLGLSAEEFTEYTGKGIESLNTMTSEELAVLPLVVDGVLWRLTEDRIGVIVLGVTEAQSNVEIPASFCDYPVVEIADSAFEGDNVLERIILPDSVERIGKRAFYNCVKLNSMN